MTPEWSERKDSLIESAEQSDEYSEAEEPGEEATMLGFSQLPKTTVNFFDIGGHRYVLVKWKSNCCIF